MSHAIVMTEPGDENVLVYTEVPQPVPGAGEVLVKMSATGINFIDIYRRRGLYPVALPHIPGTEGAGEVVAVGPDVDDIAVGDKIAFAEGINAYAEYAIVPAAKALRVPDGVDMHTAAAIPLQGMTAHYLARSTFPLEKGHVALIHAGAGGVGLLLTQLAKLHGATVITTVSTPEKAALSKQAGADHVIDYDNFDKVVRDLTDGVGVDVVYDGVGKDTFDQSMASLKVRGTLVLFGQSSGPVPPLDLQRLNAGGSLTVVRPSMGHYLLTREEQDWRAGELFDAIAAGTLDVRIGKTYPLQNAADAHRELAGRKTTGKLLLIP